MSSPAWVLRAGLALLLWQAAAAPAGAWSCENLALNQLFNCGFPSATSDWDYGGTGSWIHQQTGQPGPSGSSPDGYLLAGKPATGNPEAFQASQCRPVMPSTTYDWGGWLNDTLAGATCALLLDVYSGSGCGGSTVANDIKLFAQGSWASVHGEMNAPASATFARLMLSCTGGAPAVTLAFDEAYLVPRRCRHIFRDDFEAPEADTCEWSGGCVSNGLRVEEAISFRPNLVQLCFNHELDPTSVSGSSDVSFDQGLTETTATVFGNALLVTTSAQTAATSYTVTVAGSVASLLGTTVSGADASAVFVGYDGP